MYVGHALAAFIVCALVADLLGLDRSRGITVALLAGSFALLPDIDTVHMAYAVVQSSPTSLFPTPANVWTPEAWRVHRALTHSLFVGAIASGGVGLVGLALDRRGGSGSATVPATAAVVGFSAILLVGAATDGLTGLATAGLYVSGAVLLTGWARGRGVRPRWMAGAAATGLLTHPFGDLFMGRPPAFLYPLTTVSPIPKLAFAADPTVNLVVLFVLEVALAWGALAVVAVHGGWRLRDGLAPSAGLAVGFAGTALVIRPPTLQVAYHFAMGAIGTGLVLGVVPPVLRGRLGEHHRGVEVRVVAVTALAAVSLALVAYLVAYLALGP